MKYVAYYRVSTEKQGQSGLGLKSQKNSIQRFVDSIDGSLISEHTDIASGKSDNREGLNKAIRDCQRQGAILVVKKLDRLTRNGFKVAVQLDELGVKYIESESPNDDELLKNIKLAIAKDERKKISERTKAALKVLKDKGVKLGSPQNLTDYSREQSKKALKAKRLNNPNSLQSKAFIKAVLKANKHINLQSVADMLNNANFKTPKGGKFSKTQVLRLKKEILN